MRSNQRLNFGAPGSQMPNVTDPAEPLEAFPDKVARAIAAIRKEAAGRTCGTCKHVRNGWCAENLSYKGKNLLIMRPNAVACGQHVEERP